MKNYTKKQKIEIFNNAIKEMEEDMERSLLIIAGLKCQRDLMEILPEEKSKKARKKAQDALNRLRSRN